MNLNYLKGRRIALGVSGGIAAYKACDLIRELRRQGALVRVAMTQAAAQFVTPLTLQSLSGQSVLTDYFDVTQEANFGHLHLSRWADVYVVAPCTADLLSRLAHGQANCSVSTSLLAFRGPVLLAPAMNTAMWDSPQTQSNLKKLQSERSVVLAGPDSGPLADGDVGAGRLIELSRLVEAIATLGKGGALFGKKVLVTAGPTREFIDPVRFLSNPSTGKMGLAVAEVARSLGAEVSLVLGPTFEQVSEGFDLARVVSAEEMHREVMNRLQGTDFFVATAAVSDWKPQASSQIKLKKGIAPETLALVRTPDILAEVANGVRTSGQKMTLVGFAAETHDVEKYAQEKMQRKQLDFVVANDVGKAGSGFAIDTNKVTMLSASGKRYAFEGSKRDVAVQMWKHILQ